MAYCPDSPSFIQDRKGIRKELLINTLNATQHLQDNVGFDTLNNLEKLVCNVETISSELTVSEKVVNQDEVVLDSAVMKCSSKVLEQCTNSLSKNMSTYDVNQYVEYMLEYVRHLTELPEGDTGIYWNALENELVPLFKRTPFFSTLMGALEPLPKKPIAERKRSMMQKEIRAPTKQLEKVVEHKEVEESVETSIGKIKKLIRNYYKDNQKPLDYFQLVLHPTDFGRTIENILHVSFLTRDGLINMTIGETGSLEIVPSTKKMLSEAQKSGKHGNVQNIISLSVKQWEILKDNYNIQEPMINFRVGQKT